MPTYAYVCDACGQTLEVFQSMTESAKRKCPACGKLKLRRQIGTGGGILFRGSGFYQTDYRSESYKKAAEADKPSAISTAAKDDTASSKKSSESAKSTGSAKKDAGKSSDG